ncbi:MAG: class I SAM-dependent methyltransferase [Magnetococcales bacterium]|nr:class I SAM-dependent methyltransferase [Magnetococcales bacterium]
MRSDEYAKMYRLEDSHWWFRGKRELVATLLRRWAPRQEPAPRGLPSPRLLDVGCGTGKVLELLGDFGNAMGCDFSPDAIGFCRERGPPFLVQASAAALPFAENSFSVTCLLDALYHQGIRDDVAVLREIHRILTPGGILILTDSAFQFLYGPHDRAVHARQRYSKGEIGAKLRLAGFIVRRLGYFNCVLFPLAAAVRLLDRWRNAEAATSSLSPAPAFLNRILFGILWLESRLAAHVDLPFGLSVCAVAQKPLTEENPQGIPPPPP